MSTMPLAPQRIGRRSRLEKMFAISIGCVILSFTLCNLKNKSTEPPHSLDGYIAQSRITTSETLAGTNERSLDNLYLTAQNSTSENMKLNRETATGKQSETEMIRQHHPDFFLNHVPLENLIRRGNLLTAHTGCSIATWSYNGKRHVSKPLNECRQHARSGEIYRAHIVTPGTASQVKPYDSIYVPMVKLEHFVSETLPHIENEFILMTGQYSVPEGLEIPQRVYDAVIGHPRVVRWFLQNLSVYANDPNHPKLSPFPYGINPLQTATMLGEIEKGRNVTKGNFIYASHPRKKRSQLELTGYFTMVHHSQYVFAPVADRPETHLHYEAIGVGAMPITSLDPHLYRHLEGNVIFGEHTFNMTELEERLPKNPVVNRRLAFEEYWMEYIEREVGRPMRWWDPSSDERSSLEEIAERVNDRFSPVRVKERREKGAVVDGGTTSLLVPETATDAQKTMALISNGNLHPEASATDLQATGAHYPSYFTQEVPLEKMIARNNLLRVYTGCSIATWSYSGLRGEILSGRELSRYNDCELDKGMPALATHQIEPDTASHVQPYDSIYVPIVSLQRFVRDILPYIDNDFVLMTGQKALVPAIPRDLYDSIIEHPRVLHWFLQNLSMYAYDAHHPKISPFPYGIYRHVPDYVAEMQRNVTKENFLFVSYISKKNNYEVRKHIPRTKIKMEPHEYFQSMHNSTYVLSPDGDRPECHRHYEAIGLGTMPITGLDPFLHRHLMGNAIFGEQRWKLDEMEKKLPRNPRVNRRLIFEEYWMEYIEREIGRPMRWWDPSRNVRCSLAEITETVKNSPLVGTNNLGALSQSNAAPITQTNSAGALLPSNTSVIEELVATAINSSEALLQSNATVPQPPEAAAVTTKRLRGVVPNETKHDPNYFSEQVTIDRMVKRMNILTPYTGCSIASFQYNIFQNPHPELNDCFCHRGKEFGRSRGLRVDNAERLVKDGDVIYVQFNKLQHFVDMTLPHIQHEFVLISGQEQKVEPFSKEAFDAIVKNPKLMHWFMMNMDVYSYEPHHTKISPWPYGSNPKTLMDFKDELRKPAPEKNNFIYLSGLSRSTNPQRRNIPRGPKVNVKRYFGEMRVGQYVLSPDGDRPECYRHYEAIGMGTMPITQLDARMHSHLQGNAVFNNAVWNLTVLEATLPQNPQVNQRLVFEEYWMEYVERIVGRPLRWWDPSRDVHASLAEITETVKNSLSAEIAGNPMGETAS